MEIYMKKTIFYIIRHGKQTYEDVERLHFIGMGLEMCQLTEEGKSQAYICSKDTRLFGSNIILSSPYTRALQTAAIISKELKIDIEIEQDLREQDLDISFQAKSLLELQAFAKESNPEKTETWDQVRARVLKVFEKYTKYEKVIVVAHGGVIHALTGIVGIPNCSIHEYILES
jgi:broad specificity phosphatase PhoE